MAPSSAKEALWDHACQGIGTAATLLRTCRGAAAPGRWAGLPHPRAIQARQEGGDRHQAQRDEPDPPATIQRPADAPALAAATGGGGAAERLAAAGADHPPGQGPVGAHRPAAAVRTGHRR